MILSRGQFLSVNIMINDLEQKLKLSESFIYLKKTVCDHNTLGVLIVFLSVGEIIKLSD